MAFAFPSGGPSDPITAPARNPPVRRLSLLLVVAFALHLAAAVPALAVDTDWTGAVNGDWSTAGNWSAGTPTVADNAFLPSPLASNPVIALPPAAAANRLTVTGSGYSLTTGSLALHAAALELPHPASGRRLALAAPPPDHAPWDRYTFALDRILSPQP